MNFEDKQSSHDQTVLQLGAPQQSGQADLDWQHEANIDQVVTILNTNVNFGLSTAEAEKRLKKYGSNELTEQLGRPWWIELLSHFTDLFSLMLQTAGVLSFIAYLYERSDHTHLYLGIFLYSVVIFTSLFTFFQQRRSDRILREFRNLIPPTANVLRDRKPPTLVAANALVPGDIVHISAGDRIPADIRIVRSDDIFAVDNAPLTGESTPVILNSKPSPSGSSALDSGNIAFFGCFAVEGSCIGVVVATGDTTAFGRIASLTAGMNGVDSERDDKNDESMRTTLQRDVRHFVVRVSVFAIIVGIICFIAGFYLRVRLAQNVVYTLGIIVSNIPEGLLATVTVSLTASAKRMAGKNVLVKRLDAIETLGSTNVIVTDKTGTLTQARMSVAHIAYAGTVHTVASDWKQPTNEDGTNVQHAFSTLLHGASVCSSAYFDRSVEDLNKDDDEDDKSNSDDSSDDNDNTSSKKKQKHKKSNQQQKLNVDPPIRGDASEAGVLRFTERIHNTMEYRAKLEITTKVPFNSRNKLMVTVDNSLEEENAETALARVVMKGAPERVLQHCDSMLGSNGLRTLSTDDRRLIERQVSYFAQRGERVLAYAEKILPKASIFNATLSTDTLIVDSTSEFLECVGALQFIGLLSLTDPPRDGASQTVHSLRMAGISVMMVTGDHAETAIAIGESAGILTRGVTYMSKNDGNPSEFGKAIVVNGSEVSSTLTDENWDNILSHQEVIFARASPEDKVTVVRQLRRAGYTVTTTGDGCNDAPALRAANAGVAMGCTGSDVSRAAADVVLLDDDLGSLVHGVQEGRLIFDNLKKSVAYTITSNIPQLIPFILFVLLRLPLPLTSTLVLCIDLGTDVFPAIALAYEKAEGNILRRVPRKQEEDTLLSGRLLRFSIFQLGFMQTIAGFLAYFIVFYDAGLKPETLVGLARRAYFGSTKPSRQRWLIAESMGNSKPRLLSASAYRATWFTRRDLSFQRYFSASIIPGFERQNREDYQNIQPGSIEFSNMVKIIGAERRRPPCMAYSCASGKKQNDFSCFDVDVNPGRVVVNRSRRNDQVISGNEDGEGCFELWTPSKQRHVLQTAQTAFFVAVVVAQIFTLFACRTRIESIIPLLFKNVAVWIALALEIIVALILLYVKPVSDVLRTVPLHWSYWFISLPFGIFIVGLDEVRKWFIRRHIDNTSGLIVPREDSIDKIAHFIYDLTFW